MTIRITQLRHADIFGYIANLLETARLLSSLDEGDQLAFELIEFVQLAAAKAAKAAKAANKPWDE